MSISKNLLPNTNPDQAITLKTEPKSKKIISSEKKASIVKAAESANEPVRSRTSKTRRLWQEQNDFQARTNAALSQIPEILSEIRHSEKNIQKSISLFGEEQRQLSQQISEELKWLHDARLKAEQRASYSFKLMAGAVGIFLLIGIYLIYDSKTSTKLILEKISGIESVVQQNELKDELRETRRTLSDGLRANVQSINNNNRVTQSIKKEVQGLNKSVGKLQQIVRKNPDIE